MTGSDATPSFRLAYVPGVMPDKWVRIWNERQPDVPLTLTQVPPGAAAERLLGGDADAGLVRTPVDREVFSAIPLYTEQTVVVVPKDHLVTAVDEVAPEDLADDIVLHPLDDVLDWESLPGRPALERPATTADAVELVAAGIGVLVVPLSLARLHHRKDLTHRPLKGAPESSVALAWPEDAKTDQIEDFIGIVRGRTVNSTRGRQQASARGESADADRGGARRKPAPGKSVAGRSGGAKRAGKSGRGAPKNDRRGKPRRRS
ncbi:LysR family transcriptional regulator substrate-binding protein [Streptomyces sp. NEAU-H22]|uniref:LysR family transcriptional regulator substrate-binding protein n=1 Tax=unclassified Streptomyces TaxID=2593676 RepID=UPI00224CF31B|nr:MULTISPECIES: LysR family transcriptional regulator substrate-binding protein [unclassified Streptomyces]MCX3290361.1 LysR family transcriptional regulator substrate-binding protein [Streptomyces sp. NEAU-H22]WMD07108.1 LysR family transcriptional regulator substrate-binding protein [Streptomyces sp. FXY-T5]